MSHPNPRSRTGFTLLDLIVTLAGLLIAAVLIGVLLPQFGSTGHGVHASLTNNTQLRGIHQAMVRFAETNAKGGNDGYFPGFDASGSVVPDGSDTGHSGDGTEPGARLWILLNDNYFTPDQLIAPLGNDPTKTETTLNPTTKKYHRVAASNYSYALLNTAPRGGRTQEWKLTLNTAAIVLGDRAIGTGPTGRRSIWTAPGSNDWRGGVVKNDNSAGLEVSTSFEQTKYGNNPTNTWDELFEDETGGADAFLVHDDATTAYSAR